MRDAESSALLAGTRTRSQCSANSVRRQVTSAIADAMLDTVSFDDESTLVMDYACGSGFSCDCTALLHLVENASRSPYQSKGALSQKLAPYSKSITGVDIDSAAVEQYNNKVINQGIPSEEMRAICIDVHEHLGELNGQRFDVIVCSQAYHHFPSIDATTRLLASFLKPQTGILLISDLLRGPHEHEFRRPCSHTHDYHAVVHRGGLTENEVRVSFEQAGLVDVDFEIVHNVSKDGRGVEIFMAQGRASDLRMKL